MTRIYKYKRFRKYKHHILYHILSEFYERINDASIYVPEFANRWCVPCHNITHSISRYLEISPPGEQQNSIPVTLPLTRFLSLKLRMSEGIQKRKLKIWNNSEQRPS